MEILGVSSRADMMKLRTECVKYGTSAPNKINSECGPPKFDIPKSVLKSVLENGFKISDISKLLSVSESTIYRRMSQFGLSKMNFTQIDDSDLDLTLGQIIKEFPLCGETLLQQMLLLKGIRVQRWRLRECMHRLDTAGVQARRTGPNSMVTGKSTHNQRIERLWRDVYEGVLSYFYNLFYFMEDEGYLDPLKLTNLAALHFVFMDEINRKLQFWAEAWAGHRLRTVNSSPLSLWTSGQLQNAVGITEGEANLQDYGIEGYVDQK
ncbi:Hypothetical predicted protein [Mytilus galloprovincialis]|uniref:Integrase core domain-containing protein n=1 Tax=Mytilus galloprovincialis TaxID=29158 RepID=A0A8B6HLD2_MYTGA|nr:Hypothetical predicted protein [Mytilus galloprovincialis]